jgi:hypothetical protein
VIGTTSKPDALQELELAPVFDAALEVPTLTPEEAGNILTACGVMNAQDSLRTAQAVVRADGVAVKKLFTVLELAREGGSGGDGRRTTVERFLECADVVGLSGGE